MSNPLSFPRIGVPEPLFAHTMEYQKQGTILRFLNVQDRRTRLAALIKLSPRVYRDSLFADESTVGCRICSPWIQFYRD